MSWSIYVAARSVTAIKNHIAALKEPTKESPYGTPPEAKAVVLAAIDLSGILDGIGVMVEASGHSPGGSTQIKVVPTTVLE